MISISLRAPRKDDPLHHYTLKGVLHCGCCGAAMTPGSGTSRTGETKFYYVCTTRQKRGSDACACPSLPAEAIEDAMLERVRYLTVDQHLLKALLANADAGRAEKLKALRTREDRIRRRLMEVTDELSPLVDAVKSGGAGGFRAVQDEMQRLEGIRAELELDLEAIVDQRRLLEMDRLSDDVLLSRYKDLKDVLNRSDEQELSMLLPTIVRRVDWHPDPEGSRGGRYKMVLYALPLIPMNLSPEQGSGETVGSHYCLSWLPGSDARRAPRSAIRPGRLYLEGRAWSVRVDRQPRFSVQPPQESICSLGHLKRCWHKNPIATAVEMKAALDALASPSARLVAPQFGVTRSRVAQILGLLRLPQSIINFMLDGDNEVQAGRVSESNLRRILMLRDPALQYREFEKLLAAAADAERRRGLSHQARCLGDNARMESAWVGA